MRSHIQVFFDLPFHFRFFAFRFLQRSSQAIVLSGIIFPNQLVIFGIHHTSHIVRIRRLAFVPPYFVFCSISFRCGGLSIERNQKPLAPEITLAVTHHDRQKQVEVKRSSRVNPHEIRLFSGCPYAVVKQGTKKFTKK